MQLTKENFNLYAMKHYDNPTCLSEDEFNDDLKQIKTVRRMMSRYINGEESNLRLLTNNVIIFYNCFEHHAATTMLHYTIESHQVAYFNAILKFLSLPLLIPPEDINKDFYRTLEEEFK